MAVCVASRSFNEATIPSLECPISECDGNYFPQMSISVARALSKRRLRSFGDLAKLSDADTIRYEDQPAADPAEGSLQSSSGLSIDFAFACLISGAGSCNTRFNIAEIYISQYQINCSANCDMQFQDFHDTFNKTFGKQVIQSL